MLLKVDKYSRLSKRFSKITKPFITKSFKTNITKSRLDVKASDYINVTLLNALVYFLLFASLFTMLFYSQTRVADLMNLIRGFSIGALLGVLFFVILYFYPKIIAGKIGNITDSELLFALNDILVQVKANVDLYKALVNVVEGDYGFVSDELQDVVDAVESGNSMVNALKKLALTTNSNFMKRIAWQLTNSIKSGSDAVRVIRSLIEELESYYHALISNYTKELNVLTLVYLTLAVVAPTIGITVMIILSSFGGLSLNPQMITTIIALLITVQPIIIGFINSRRPALKI